MYQLLAQFKSEVPDDFSSQFETISSSLPQPEFLSEAIFAAGSFWELEAAFCGVDGVIRTATGYYGGSLSKPCYREVMEGMTGHTEAVRVIYDKRKTSFKLLCKVFWTSHDATNKDYLQFAATTHYQSAIFYSNEEEKKQAQQSKVRHQMGLNKRIVTKIIARPSCLQSLFYLAECHHQKYYLQKNYIRLCECLSLRSSEHFADSYLACKLNGILGGNEKNAAEELKKLAQTCQLTRHTSLALDTIIQDLSMK